MAVDVDDATKPVDNSLSSPASEGAAEFRALKAKVKALFLSPKISVSVPTLIDTELGLNQNLSSAANAIVYAGAAIMTRTANAATMNTYGFLAQGILGNNVSVTNGTLNGLNVEARVGTGCALGFAYTMGILLTQQSHNIANTITQGGIYIVYADRTVAAAAAPGGVGTNRYNYNSSAIVIDSFPRSSSGEYCGWKTGIKFLPSSMDRDLAGPGFCIDFSGINYVGGTDPSTAYGMKGAIKLREYQAIYVDAGENGALFMDAASGRMTFSWGGVKRWELDVNTGEVYKNGVLQY